MVKIREGKRQSVDKIALDAVNSQSISNAATLTKNTASETLPAVTAINRVGKGRSEQEEQIDEIVVSDADGQIPVEISVLDTDQPMLLAQADLGRSVGSAPRAAAVQPPASSSMGVPPWVWVAGGLGVAGAVAAAFSGGGSSDAPPSPPANAAPVLGGYTVLLDENSPNGTAVQTVHATDADGDALTYSITAGNESGAFAIDSATGAITVADVSQLDYETTQQFSLTVQASDGTNSDIGTVAISLNNLNDNAPVFESNSYTVSLDENSINGTAVQTVQATDADGDVLSYSITGGDDFGAFAIDPVTGAITVADASQLDYETTQQFVLTVQASDGTHSDASTVTVNLSDVIEPVHVVVESGGAYLDLNANGVQDMEDVALAVFTTGGNADFATNMVTIEYNTLPTAPINLTGFGMDDKIEIDVSAVLGNMGLPDASSFVNYSGAFTGSGPQSYLWLQADNGYYFSVYFKPTIVRTTGFSSIATAPVLGFPHVGMAYWTDTATNPLGDVKNLLPGVATSYGHVVSGATSAYQELNLGAGHGVLVDFLWPQTTYVVVDNHGVEPAAMWVDANANGVLDSDETTLALLGQDQADVDAFNAVTGSTYDSQAVDLSSETVIIHYNDLPGTDWTPSLEGFDANDRIEIDVNAMRFDVDSSLRGSQSRVSITSTLPTLSGFGLLGYSNSPPDAVFERTYDSALFFGHLGTTQIGSPSFTTTVNAFLMTAPSEGAIATNGAPFPYYNQVDFVVPAV